MPDNHLWTWTLCTANVRSGSCRHKLYLQVHYPFLSLQDRPRRPPSRLGARSMAQGLVLLFCDATARTSASPFNHAVRLFLFIRRVCRYSVKTKVFLLKNARNLPVTCIAIHCDVFLTRVRLKEHHGHVLLYSRCGGSSEVEVVEEPGK